MQIHTTVLQFSHAHKLKGMSDRVIVVCSPEGFETRSSYEVRLKGTKLIFILTEYKQHSPSSRTNKLTVLQLNE
jgi:hypothetical protein